MNRCTNQETVRVMMFLSFSSMVFLSSLYPINLSSQITTASDSKRLTKTKKQLNFFNSISQKKQKTFPISIVEDSTIQSLHMLNIDSKL